MYDELQPKVIYLCVMFVLKDVECHCAKVTCPQTDSVKSSVPSFCCEIESFAKATDR